MTVRSRPAHRRVKRARPVRPPKPVRAAYAFPGLGCYITLTYRQARVIDKSMLYRRPEFTPQAGDRRRQLELAAIISPAVHKAAE